MAIIKCKMCGGDLTLIEGQSVAECEYCGSVQTVPAADNEKKLALFARANRLRAACEFDKAAGIYETIVADFSEEAEAYWGLVLCKYGIEYVDDPATGKKIPTCHRSSFDSVMDDANFEQALENADTVARRVYREQAKQLEEIRKGIIEVSAKETPYDIFICYKETDEKGDRTLDSVLAQDVYDALTDKGYRTFFARITLEDKLGQEYEPYIFAALNSAKIMLAVGTDYEYFNAVWVKNEWSRFLKLMEKDKSKHLIPCYKGIDAYDMPKEFARLQAQDLGKMGAIQDILRGVEKLLPRKQNNTNVIQERVVVGNAGGSNKIASLLDRGNMALEDGDWAKADSFFEDVLNNDSKNAQAYIGKTLAQERCRTMDALVRKRRDVHQNVGSETLYIQTKDAHIREMVEQYSLPGYVSEDSIRKLYHFDLSYTSQVPGRQKQYREEDSWWQNHRQLSRAEKFAVGAVAETLQKEKKHLFSQLSDRVKKAQEADARTVAKLEADYVAHIAQMDVKAEQLHNEGLARREKDYRYWLDTAKNDSKVENLRQAQTFFEQQSVYKDSKALAEHCRKRIADITAELERKDAERKAAQEAEAERQRILAAKLEKQRKARKKKIAILSAVAAVVVIAVIVVMVTVVIPSQKYAKAETMLENGDYRAAVEAFDALGDFKDSAQAEKYAYANYFITCARNLDNDGEELLKEMFADTDASAEENAASPEKTEAMIQEMIECLKVFEAGEKLYEAAAREVLISYFGEVDEATFEKVFQMYIGETAQLEQTECYLSDDLAMAENYFQGARTLLEELGDYRDSVALLASIPGEWTAILDMRYEEGEQLLAAEDYEAAQAVFEGLEEHRDSADKATQARNGVAYEYAVSLLSYGYSADYDAIAEARSILLAVGDFEDATNYLSQIQERVISISRFTEGASKYSYDDEIKITPYYYNALGQETVYKYSADGEPTEELYVYNELGQLIKDTQYSYEYNAQGYVSRKYNETFDYKYTYDNHGNVIKQEYLSNLGSSKFSSTYQYNYQYTNGLVTEKSWRSGDDTNTITYTYDSDSRLIKEVRKEGYHTYKILYTYDSDGRLMELDFSGISDSKDYVDTYTYGYIWAPEQQ